LFVPEILKHENSHKGAKAQRFTKVFLKVFVALVAKNHAPVLDIHAGCSIIYHFKTKTRRFYE
jgi:hypothetical protein